MLNNGDAHLQTTLNRHCSPTKVAVNRQYGLENFKYAIVLDPCLQVT